MYFKIPQPCNDSIPVLLAAPDIPPSETEKSTSSHEDATSPSPDEEEILEDEMLLDDDNEFSGETSAKRRRTRTNFTCELNLESFFFSSKRFNEKLLLAENSY
uniref:Uncharacterized protein n=1 Tax=Caenorhabditis japonica TaxID=281687 RepID=A0A8R1IQJ4_CAEJA